MLIDIIKNWNGAVEINGTLYDSVNADNLACIKSSDIINIKLLHSEKIKNSLITNGNKACYQITVKKYMTKKATAEFDFMERWNNNIPMPLRVMVGTVEKETRGMIYMKLHADILTDRVHTCMKCGRALTNPVSQYFGIGPECGGHNYIHPFNTEKELRQAVADYRKQLQKIQWEGWIIKSAIIEKQAV